jgi:hypothetical protein
LQTYFSILPNFFAKKNKLDFGSNIILTGGIVMFEGVAQQLMQFTAVGIVATLLMDAWAYLLKNAAGLPTTDWALVGRWFGHLPRGRLIHAPIADSAAVRGELVIGWVAHYAIGVLYALVYAAILSVTIGTPTLISAVLFGLITLIAPWFILQPGMGAGVFARLAPQPNLSRAINISMHVVFGAALYLGWLLISAIQDLG